MITKIRNFNTLPEFMAAFAKLRIANKGKWYTMAGVISNTKYKLKAYGNWVQRFELSNSNGQVVDGSASDPKVKVLNDWLIDMIEPIVDAE